MHPPAPESALRLEGIAKSFGPTIALDGVDLVVRPGEVHALIGENGAGKSTLMNVVAGGLRPDAGSMTLFGEPYAPGSTLEARRRAVALIHQELSLCPHLSVTENIVLGQESASEWVHIFMGVGFVTGVESRPAAVGLEASDHVAFLDKGIPAVHLFSGPSPEYHQPSDVVDRIDTEKASRLVRYVFHITAAVANDPARPRWNPGSHDRLLEER